MRDPQGYRPLCQLEPPAEATFYGTTPLAGTKRQRADDGDEEDTTYPCDSALQDNQTEQLGENKVQHVSEIVNDDTTQADVPNPVKKRKVGKAKVTTEKNKTRTTINGLEVDIDGSWYPAIDHKEYVETFKDQLFTPRYTHGRASGTVGEKKGEFDKTAYLESQKDWGKSRNHRPAILFEFKKPENAYPPTDPPALACTKNGVTQVVIDSIKNKPLRAFPHIPAVVSTKAEGWLQEAWFRQDPGLQAEDLIQRMPYTTEHGVYDNRKIINRMVRRRELFRDEGRCLSWKKAIYEKICDLDLIDQMARYPNPAEPNSTRHLHDLTSEELQAFKDATYVTKKYLQRGKGRELEGERREQKDREVGERMAARAAEAATTTVESQKANNHPGVERTQREESSTQSTKMQTVYSMTTVQPQQYLTQQAVRHQPDLMAPQNIQSIAPQRMTNRHDQEQSHNEFSGGYQHHEHHGYPVQSAAPQAMSHPFLSSMNGNSLHAPPAFTAMNRPYITQRPGEQPSDLAARHSMVANLRALQATQGIHGRNGARSNFGRMSAMSGRAPTSSGEVRRAIPQSPSSNFVGDPMNHNIRSQPYPVGRHLHHNFVANDIGSHLSPLDAYLDHDWKTHEFMSNDFNYEGPGLHPSGVVSEQQPLPAPQQQYRSRHVVEDSDFWRAFDISGSQESGCPEYDPGLYLDSAGQGSSRHRATVDEHPQQAEYLGPQRRVATALGHTSSRKRGAEAEFDSGLGNSSRKFRKLN